MIEGAEGLRSGLRSEEFALPIKMFRDGAKLEVFRKIASPFILRRPKTNKSIIKNLPDKLEIDRFCQLCKGQAALYQTTMN